MKITNFLGVLLGLKGGSIVLISQDKIWDKLLLFIRLFQSSKKVSQKSAYLKSLYSMVCEMDSRVDVRKRALNYEFFI